MSEKLMSTGERIARKYVAHQITIAKFAAEIDAAIAEALPRVDDEVVRKAFEKWGTEKHLWVNFRRKDGVNYDAKIINEAWGIWQAAIAALTTPEVMKL